MNNNALFKHEKKRIDFLSRGGYNNEGVWHMTTTATPGGYQLIGDMRYVILYIQNLAIDHHYQHCCCVFTMPFPWC